MHRSTWTVLCVVAAALAGCGSSYTKDDSTSNNVAVRNEAAVLALCAQDDAGTCTPSMVRARTSVAFCAPFDGGIPCQAP